METLQPNVVCARLHDTELSEATIAERFAGIFYPGLEMRDWYVSDRIPKPIGNDTYLPPTQDNWLKRVQALLDEGQ